jgi:thioester reductase-like protein
VGQSILLTGATGALGPHLLQELLQADDFERLFVVVRPGSDPRARLHDTLRRVTEGTGRTWSPRLDPRIIPVHGDLCREDLALDAGVAARVRREVDVVVHAAANTRFTAPEADLYEVNTGGTLRVLQLASRCVRLRQALIISTTCVAGTRTGTIAERVEQEAPDFVNAYERTKWQAERVAAATDLPIRIARLSTCVGDGRTGYVHRFGAVHHALHWFMRGLIPIVPAVDGSCVDLIPTDCAARWLARAAARPVGRLEVCQVAASHRAIPLEEFLAFVVERLRAGCEGWSRRQIEAPAVADGRTFSLFERAAMQSRDPVFSRVFESMHTFLPALLHPKVYDTHNADACWGGPLPVGDWRFTLGRVLDFVREQTRDRGRARAAAGVSYA